VPEVLVEEGQSVQQGDVLVRLKGEEDLTAAITAARTELTAAQKTLDDLDKAADSSATQTLQLIADLERQEQERTGIKSLKVRFNSVFGYYIDVTKANLHLVPADYIRRQTTVGGERYVTEALKQKEKEIFSAEDGYTTQPDWPWARSATCGPAAHPASRRKAINTAGRGAIGINAVMVI